jgi:hypothetical protein
MRVIGWDKFIWRGLGLHLGNRRKPVLTLVADDTYPHLYRIRYPNGWMSTPGNLTRAKDAAYGHARYLLGEESVASAVPAGEDDVVALTLPATTKEAA